MLNLREHAIRQRRDEQRLELRTDARPAGGVDEGGRHVGEDGQRSLVRRRLAGGARLLHEAHQLGPCALCVHLDADAADGVADLTPQRGVAGRLERQKKLALERSLPFVRQHWHLVRGSHREHAESRRRSKTAERPRTAGSAEGLASVSTSWLARSAGLVS